MSGKGNWYENAMTGSFFGSVKDEGVPRMVFQTREDARRSLFEYLEVFSNRQRRHSSLGSLSPVAFEQQWELSAKNLAVFSPDEGLT
jgi:transposase InsO family protein